MEQRKINIEILDTINETSDGKFMFVYTFGLRTLRWTKAAKNYFGFSKLEMDGCDREWEEHIHPRDREKYEKELNEVLSLQKESFFLLFHMRNAREQYYLCRGKGKIIRDEAGVPVYFAGSVTLCTEEIVYDSVSGLQNTNGFHKTIHKYNEEARPYIAMAIELANLAEINTLYNYNFGSKIIFELSKQFHDMMDGVGHVFRIEGSRFVFVLKSKELCNIQELFSKVRTLCRRYELDGNTINIEIVGGTIYTEKWGNDPQEILSCLTSILERRKTEGSYELLVYDDEMHEKTHQSLELLSAIRTDVLKGCEGFYLCYQPFVSTISGKVIGAEALIRFRNEAFGEVAPYRFIEQLEAHPCFYQLGIWVLRRAIEDAKSILAIQPNFFINVNISYSQIEKPQFAAEVIGILEELDFPKDHLQLELTERCWNLNMDYLKQQLAVLREQGIKIALDDYGTGTSTIDMLCELPIDCIKIDQTFIRNILKHDNNRVIVDTTLQCTSRLGINVCLEGVEDEEIKDFVGQYSASYHQGYYYSRPVEYKDFLKFLDHTWNMDCINIIHANDKGVFDVTNVLSVFPGAFFIYRNDEEEKIICANEELLRMFECEDEREFKELTNNSFKGIVHPEDYDSVEESINRQVSDQGNNAYDAVKYKIRTKKGNEYMVQDYGHLVRNEYNEEVFYVFLAKAMDE